MNNEQTANFQRDIRRNAESLTSSYWQLRAYKHELHCLYTQYKELKKHVQQLENEQKKRKLSLKKKGK